MTSRDAYVLNGPVLSRSFPGRTECLARAQVGNENHASLPGRYRKALSTPQNPPEGMKEEIRDPAMRHTYLSMMALTTCRKRIRFLPLAPWPHPLPFITSSSRPGPPHASGARSPPCCCRCARKTR